jgi:hypothetical protein
VVFFRGFPIPSNRCLSTDLISQTSSPFRNYHFLAAPTLTVPIPNLPVNVAEMPLESLRSFGGMKDVFFFETYIKFVELK